MNKFTHLKTGDLLPLRIAGTLERTKVFKVTNKRVYVTLIENPAGGLYWTKDLSVATRVTAKQS